MKQWMSTEKIGKAYAIREKVVFVVDGGGMQDYCYWYR